MNCADYPGVFRELSKTINSICERYASREKDTKALADFVQRAAGQHSLGETVTVPDVQFHGDLGEIARCVTETTNIQITNYTQIATFIEALANGDFSVSLDKLQGRNSSLLTQPISYAQAANDFASMWKRLCAPPAAVR